MNPTATVLQNRTRTWRHVLAASVLVAACCLPAFNAARGAVKHLSEPYDLDQFRDLASAQAAADGRYLSDPFYDGETMWYNPLLPWTVAAISRVRGVSVSTALVRSGPYLNVLAPIALFVVMTSLFGPWPASIAVVSLVYASPHNDPPWVTPSYSPWSFTSNFASGLFYLALAIALRALRSGTTRAWCAAGLALGIVFMAHTAPALVLALVMLAEALPWAHSAANPAPISRVTALTIVFGTAILVSVPLLWSIVGRYHLHVVNTAPAAWAWNGVPSVSGIVGGARHIRSIVALIGVAVLVRRIRVTVEARIVLAWAAGAFILFEYTFIQRSLGPRFPFPLPLPQFHFYFYLRAVGYVLVGVAVWDIITWAAAAAVRRSRLPLAAAPVAASAMVAGLMAALAAAESGAYRAGAALTDGVAAARQATFRQFESDLTARLRAQTPPDAIVLASPDESLTDVAPAGRSVVAVPAEFSNPYVAFEPRARAQARLLESLIAHDQHTFVAIARAQRVTHVVLTPAELAAFDEHAGAFDAVRELSRQSGFAIFIVRLGAGSGAR